VLEGLDKMSKLTEKEALHRSRASCLQNVKNLNCWGSDLHDISIIRNMINLQVLNLSANNITSLKDISYCPRLKELYLRRNLLGSVDEIKYLKNLPNLSVLWLADNPCAEEPNYREIVIQNLPHLNKFDSLEITPEEKANAINSNNSLSIADVELPNFDNLNLSHTLSFDDVKNIKMLNFNNVMKPMESKIVRQTSSIFSKNCKKEEIVPKFIPAEQKFYKTETSISVDIDKTNQLRKELGLKSLDISPTLSNKSDTHSSANGISNTSNSLVTTSDNNNKTTSNSNVMSAIYLLMNDLNITELSNVAEHAKQLIEENNSLILNLKQEDLLL